MTPSPSRWRQPLYVWTVFAGAVLVLIALSPGMEGLGNAIDSGSYLALWATMILVAAMSPLPLPWGNATASLSPALDLAAILVFGPAVACWVGVVSRLITNATHRWRPILPAVLGLGQTVLAIAAGGYLYTQLGGLWGADLTLGQSQMAPLAAAVAAYVLAKSALGALAHVFEPSAPGTHRGRTVLRAFADPVPGELLVLPVGPLLALTQLRIGPVGVALFLLPLLFARYVVNLWRQTKSAHLHMVRVLMAAVDAADPFTRDHSYRVSRMSLRVGRHLGLRDMALEELEFAALLHDIGRTAIQRDVLVKRGKLTEQEMLLLRAHPRIGADLLAGMRFFPGASEIVHAHHEQPDGKGYPRGLVADSVPLGSRIIMAVAAFDAMTSDRPYRRGLSPDEALEELLAHSGTQFYPDVVEALIHLYASGTLFADFEEAHLERYRDGHEHSRAVEEYLKTRGANVGVPTKAFPRAAGARKRTVAIPVIELPAAEEAPLRTQAVVPLKAKGDWSFEVAGMSDVGCQRKNNEDSYGVFQFDEQWRGCLLVLADGMGGAAAGEVASRLTVETVSDAYAQWKKKNSPREALANAIAAANRAVHAQASSETQYEGMGTTCTVAAVTGLDLTLGHVGDSRAYLVRRGTIEQLTTDHTFAAELARVANGRPTAVPEASSHVLTRCVGAQPDVQVDLSDRPWHLEDGAVVVLCSDGLTNLVEPEEIQDFVSRQAPAEACEGLVELARARGGSDNITLIVGRWTKR